MLRKRKGNCFEFVFSRKSSFMWFFLCMSMVLNDLVTRESTKIWGKGERKLSIKTCMIDKSKILEINLDHYLTLFGH